MHLHAIRALNDNDNKVFALLKKDATLRVELQGGQEPKRKTDTAAGFELYASQNQEVASNATLQIPTGIRIQLPVGTYRRITPVGNPLAKGI